MELYTHQTPEKPLFEIVKRQFEIKDKVLDEDEIGRAIGRLKRDRAPGATGL